MRVMTIRKHSRATWEIRAAGFLASRAGDFWAVLLWVEASPQVTTRLAALS